MRVWLAAAVITLLAGPAWAQTQQPIPRYGEPAKTSSPQEIEAERQADRAYKKSLGNIPDQGPTDPWGNVRSNSAPKTTAKAAPAKHTKAGKTGN